VFEAPAWPIAVRSNPRPIDELNVPAGTLALVTPAARDEEAAVLAAALAAVPPEPRWAEPFLLPVEGRDTSGFGDPRRYAPGGNVSYHLGADIAAPTGTPILATNDGIVRVAGFYPIKGGWVVLDHGQGVTSHHFHLSRVAVGVGDVVVRGEVIGDVGSTGLSTGPHLHWEMRVDGVPTDPMAWVGQRYPLVVRP
jgi:murein DD-endopeptidase MepM/ murein hydrolase activator NlpD